MNEIDAEDRKTNTEFRKIEMAEEEIGRIPRHMSTASNLEAVQMDRANLRSASRTDA